MMLEYNPQIFENGTVFSPGREQRVVAAFPEAQAYPPSSREDEFILQ